MIGQIAKAFKPRVTGNLKITLEALLPQYRDMLRAFYRNHDAAATPIAANRWLHRELIARFGAQEVLGAARKIEGRLNTARRGVLVEMKKGGNR